jgi:hypothetical protein
MHNLLKDNRISSIIFPLSTYRCEQRSWCISTILLSIKCKCRRLVFSLFQSCSLKQLYHIYTRLYITSNLRIPLTYCHACLALSLSKTLFDSLLIDFDIFFLRVGVNSNPHRPSICQYLFVLLVSISFSDFHHYIHIAASILVRGRPKQIWERTQSV